ncbi:hypothetical protein JHD50_06095, partial [Sulfurimonas sp. MAG313]
ELRNLVSKNSRIQSGMEVTLEEFVDDEDTKNFVFLFPLLKSEPSQVEMDFIDAHKLPLQESERFFSFQNPQYWIHRAESLAAAEEAAARQEALLRAKKASERKKAALRLAKAKAFAKEKLRKEKEYRQKQYKAKVEQSRRKKALEQCGKYISADQYSGREALLEGNVMFMVSEPGNKKFGYGIKAREDQKIYFIRDPKNIANAKSGQSISWILKTMGRTEALSKKTKILYTYDKKSNTKFTMALFIKECTIR